MAEVKIELGRMRRTKLRHDTVRTWVPDQRAHDVWLVWLDGRLVALDAATGKELWEVLTIDRSERYSITGAVRAIKGRILVGTASWTDPTMTAAGVFYPLGADSAEERLAYYASSFPVVEVDSTYYALPAERTSASRASASSSWKGMRPALTAATRSGLVSTRST